MFIIRYESLPEGFWLEFSLVMGGFLCFFTLVPFFTRRWMQADKKKWFSYNHMNDFHKKWDWSLRFCPVPALLICYIFFTYQPLILPVVVGIFVVIQAGFQAYVEWKYTDNPSNYKATLIEMVMIIIGIGSLVIWLQAFLVPA